MNVLHLINCIKTGGAEKLLVDILENSTEKNAYLYVINQSEERRMMQSVRAKAQGVRLFGKKEGDKSLKSVLKVVKDIRKYCRDHDIRIIHVHNESTLFYAFLVRLGLPRIRLVFTLHMVLNDYSAFCRLIVSLSRCEMIAVSRAVEESAQRYFNPKRIHLIYNGINLDKYRLPKKPHEKIHLCCVARLVPEIKGQDLLLQALVKLKEHFTDFHCYIAGEPATVDGITQDQVYHQLNTIVKQGRLESYVTFCGNVTDIPEFLRNMDYLILPSRSEGLGLVLLEAMASGTLAVASNIDGPREIISHGVNGFLFEAGNSDDLFEVLQKAIKDNHQKILTQAHQDVQRFDISTMLDNYNKLYDAVI